MISPNMPYSTALTDFLNLKFKINKEDSPQEFLEFYKEWLIKYGPWHFYLPDDVDYLAKVGFVWESPIAISSVVFPNLTHLYDNGNDADRVRRYVLNSIERLEDYFTPGGPKIEELIEEIWGEHIAKSDLRLSTKSQDGRYVYNVELCRPRRNMPIDEYVARYCIFEAYMDRKHKKTDLARIKPCKVCGKFFASSSKSVIRCSKCSNKEK